MIAPSKRTHRYATLMTLVALVEAALLFAAHHVLQTPACSAEAGARVTAYTARIPFAGALFAARLPAAPASLPEPATSTSPAMLPPSAPVPAAPASDASGAAADDGAAAPDSKPSGSLNDVPDPNCVAHQAAALLSTAQTKAQPTCGPLKAPEALKAAARSIP